MKLANICRSDKASDLVVDLKDYFGVHSDRELVEIALTLTGIVVANEEQGEVIIENAATGRRMALELKKQPANVVKFPNMQRPSLEIRSPHGQNDCA